MSPGDRLARPDVMDVTVWPGRPVGAPFYLPSLVRDGCPRGCPHEDEDDEGHEGDERG